ncbi:hypothetical protein BSKO_10466 [Bryopsis sp. KO-2023]|nr:hypothetical protein BSKO_10466 [Bryopsis sp. KO-2023]
MFAFAHSTPCARVVPAVRAGRLSARRCIAVAPIRRRFANAPTRSFRSSVCVQAGLNKGDSLTSYAEYKKSVASSGGGKVTLSSFKGKKPVVLFFYPKAGTPGCTKEAQKFRDDYAKFKKVGAAVFGISGDSLDEQKAFSSAESLPYPLLVDEGDALRKGFGIKSDLFGALPGRQTFVIGKDGTCLLSYNNQLSPEKHVDEALKALQ